MQDSWLRKKVEEIQSCADRKKFMMYGTKRSEAITLLDADGSTLLTDKDAILKGGQSSSIECAIGHQAYMMMISTDSHSSMNFRSSLKHQKQFKHCHLVTHGRENDRTASLYVENGI